MPCSATEPFVCGRRSPGRDSPGRSTRAWSPRHRHRRSRGSVAAGRCLVVIPVSRSRLIHAGQVGALMPELWTVADLLEQVGDEGRRVHGLAPCRNPEPGFRQMTGEHAGVVAIALDSAGVARMPCFLSPAAPWVIVPARRCPAGSRFPRRVSGREAGSGRRSRRPARAGREGA